MESKKKLWQAPFDHGEDVPLLLRYANKLRENDGMSGRQEAREVVGQKYRKMEKMLLEETPLEETPLEKMLLEETILDETLSKKRRVEDLVIDEVKRVIDALEEKYESGKNMVVSSVEIRNEISFLEGFTHEGDGFGEILFERRRGKTQEQLLQEKRERYQRRIGEINREYKTFLDDQVKNRDLLRKSVIEHRKEEFKESRKRERLLKEHEIRRQKAIEQRSIERERERIEMEKAEVERERLFKEKRKREEKARVEREIF